MDDQEVTAILADPSKRILGDLAWAEPSPGSPWVKFRAVIENSEGWPLKACGSYNRENQKASFCILHPAVKDRLYGLELGSAHRQGDGTMIEGTHKHRVLDVFVPTDITAAQGEPVKAWREFCAEANIEHAGNLPEPPPMQAQLW